MNTLQMTQVVGNLNLDVVYIININTPPLLLEVNSSLLRAREVKYLLFIPNKEVSARTVLDSKIQALASFGCKLTTFR